MPQRIELLADGLHENTWVSDGMKYYCIPATFLSVFFCLPQVVQRPIILTGVPMNRVIVGTGEEGRNEWMRFLE